MKIEYDPEADAVYIYLREGVPFAFTHNVDDALTTCPSASSSWA